MDEAGEDLCTTCRHPDHDDDEDGCPVLLAVYLGADGWAEGGPCGCRASRAWTPLGIGDDPWSTQGPTPEPPF